MLFKGSHAFHMRGKKENAQKNVRYAPFKATLYDPCISCPQERSFSSKETFGQNQPQHQGLSCHTKPELVISVVLYNPPPHHCSPIYKEKVIYKGALQSWG